jgi:hypothetical protein
LQIKNKTKLKTRPTTAGTQKTAKTKMPARLETGLKTEVRGTQRIPKTEPKTKAHRTPKKQKTETEKPKAQGIPTTELTTEPKTEIPKTPETPKAKTQETPGKNNLS